MARKKRMTVKQWQTCTNPEVMLDFLHEKMSVRKRRLFACACCRRIWNLLADQRFRQAIEVAERYADGLAEEQERKRALRRARNARTATYAAWQANDPGFASLLPAAGYLAAHAAGCAAAVVAEPLADVRDSGLQDTRYLLELVANNTALAIAQSRREGGNPNIVEKEALAANCDLLREMVAPPAFRPSPQLPAWLAWNGGIVVRLALGAYEERAFDRLPIVADALEEAGCDDATMLEHLRGPGPHALGCWVVDLLLARG
jgi:hypothetical protein